MVRAQVGLLNGILANNIDGIATIKSFVTEGAEVARVRGASEAYRSAIAVSSAFSPLIRMVSQTAFGEEGRLPWRSGLSLRISSGAAVSQRALAAASRMVSAEKKNTAPSYS